jgi:DNA helicase HerA-like ATPase
MPAAPRSPPPPPSAGASAGRVRALILPAREPDSRELDLSAVPFTPWRTFVAEHDFTPGEHVTGIARTGGGKTTLFARGLLALYPFVIYLGTKEHDPSSYRYLQGQGYRMTSSARLDARRYPRVIFRPGPFGIAKADKEAQRERFAAVLAVAYQQERWAIYCDEIAYLDEIGLATELESIWRTGRGREITMIAASQNPVSIPRVAFDQVTHLFFWRTADRERVVRMGEMAGENRAAVQAILPKLPRYEALYVNTITDEMARTRYSPG